MFSTNGVRLVPAGSSEAIRLPYAKAAAFAFLVWDSILTFEEEIEYVWG